MSQYSRGHAAASFQHSSAVIPFNHYSLDPDHSSTADAVALYRNDRFGMTRAKEKAFRPAGTTWVVCCIAANHRSYFAAQQALLPAKNQTLEL
ncbi:hypothetical protein J2850_003814 [Azospirillum picis]|uniref:hypothetical protein n=1 Tax=Azospirillum picis TaxID=488438 RepID=UPI001AE81721|nr:hypothetical protein [Azospirillum picis]MBP2301097.1 hypothetical protein [Azospirillum picis]